MSTQPHEVRDRSALRTSVLIGLCCFVIYNANRRAITAGDTYPTRYLPFAVLQYRTVLMNPIEKVAAQGRGTSAYWMIRLPDGPILSLYPVVQPVLIAPLYVPAVAYLRMSGWTDARLDYVAKMMEKIIASLLAALSAALLYLLLRRRTTARTALLLTVAYAFGTTTWVISSQALWQHGIEQLMVIAVMLLLTGPYSAPRALGVGLLCGLIACNRPPDTILAAALGLYALYWAGRRGVVLLGASAILPTLPVIIYNLHYTERIAGGYGLALGASHFFDHPLLPGIAGSLFSPAKGLFVYSPFLLFLFLAWRYLPRERGERLFSLLLSLAVVADVILYGKIDWRGGLSWGPRYFTDALPFLIWLLVPVVAALRGIGRMCFLIAVGVSIAIEAIGAFAYSGWMDTPLFGTERSPSKMDASWQWKNASFLVSLKHGLAPSQWSAMPQGSFDGIVVDGRAVTALTSGDAAAATGWALVGRQSPWQVAVLIDGRGVGAAGTFTHRPDVVATLHEPNPSGWSIPIDTSQLTQGEHTLTAFVWSVANGESYYLAERTLTVRMAPAADVAIPASAIAKGEEDLAESFRKAVGQIRSHQQPAEGYWLAAYTNGKEYRTARPEFNTFLTSLLVDLLDPVAATSRLEDNLRRAREHLTRQIEPGGLVRYHGRPDSPWIGTLGCVITPDTDDTALVWRIAPSPDRSQLASALATIDRYRRPDGLYKTWLAPREQYECLDPGSDPNPADLTIQMHLLLLLSEARPEEGRALCNALRPLVDDNRVWVYYRKAPLVPILRVPDLRRAGCALELPQSRMRSDVPGQQTWITVARLLGEATPDRERTRAILRELAQDDFAFVRTTPPLFYHNDLSATVSRCYWSEDVGYALWLRLYDRYQHPTDPAP